MPYFFYSMIGLAIKTFWASYSTTPFSINNSWKILLGVSPNATMWFLWTLLIISVIYFCLGKVLDSYGIKRNVKCMIYLLLGLILLILYYFFPDCIINNLLKFTIYYSIGIVVATLNDKIKQWIKKSKYVVLSSLVAVAFILILPLFHVNYFVTCCLAIYFVMIVSNQLNNCSGFIRKVLDVLGTYSYDLYLVSYFVQRPIRYILYVKLSCSYTLTVIAMFFSGVIVSLGLSIYLLRRIKLVRYLALGEVWF